MNRNLAFAACASVAVVAAVVMGFLEAGSPEAQRLANADEVRLRDLNMINFAVARYRSAHGELPEDLAQLDGATGYSLNDPETGAPYEYRAVDETRFELCAVFATDNREQGRAQGRAHGAGRQCFHYP